MAVGSDTGVDFLGLYREDADKIGNDRVQEALIPLAAEWLEGGGEPAERVM